ncbi:recombinase RecT, partial [Escherichia coli]|uniref:recombinase RecT n=1 Tax=Escherichia coli TaxID=562 RepID=UPI001E648D6B
ADRNRSHWSTSKTPSYTKSVSWQHHPHWEEMAKKTAIRRLFKYLPVSIEIQRAVSMDEKEPLTIDPADSSVLTGEYSVIDNSEE